MRSCRKSLSLEHPIIAPEFCMQGTDVVAIGSLNSCNVFFAEPHPAHSFTDLREEA